MEADFSVRGEIVEWDKEKDIIRLLQVDGTVLEIFFDRFKYTDEVWDALNGYDRHNGIFGKKHLVLVRGKKEYDPEQSGNKETYTATSIRLLKALCSANSSETVEDFKVCGEIVEWDKENETARILLANKTTLEVHLANHDYDDVIRDSFNGYDKNSGLLRRRHLVLLRGKKEYDSEQWINDEEEYFVTYAEKLHPLDPIYRLEQLEMVEDDWDGEGTKAPPKEDIEWFKGFFINHFPADLCLPYLTLGDGYFFLEWVKPGCDWEATFEIEYGTHIARGYIENLKGEDELKNGELVEEDMRCDLNNEEEIKSWIKMLRVMGGRETA